MICLSQTLKQSKNKHNSWTHRCDENSKSLVKGLEDGWEIGTIMKNEIKSFCTVVFWGKICADLFLGTKRRKQ